MKRYLKIKRDDLIDILIVIALGLFWGYIFWFATLEIYEGIIYNLDWRDDVAYMIFSVITYVCIFVWFCLGKMLGRFHPY